MKRIFLTVGTHREQFNRLVKEMDRLMGEGRVKAEVFGQIGNSTYEPKNFPFTRFLTDKEYREKATQSNLVVAHGGAGGIITALKERKPLIVVPRLKRFKEHTNDHQIELGKAIEGKGKAIALIDVSGLERAVNEAWKKRFSYGSGGTGIGKAIEEFFEREGLVKE